MFSNKREWHVVSEKITSSRWARKTDETENTKNHEEVNDTKMII